MKTKFKMMAYAVVWTKGTTEEWEGEPQQPLDFEPLQSCELANPIMFYLEEEKRDVYVAPIAVFTYKNEAEAWLNDFASNTDSFEVREVELTVI